jgi:hypothetical protein
MEKERGENKKGKPGTRIDTHSPYSEPSGVPGLPAPRNPVPAAKDWERWTLCPSGSVATATASAAEPASIAASGNQRPTGSGIDLGRTGCCSGPKQVALKFSPAGDPTLLGAAKWPSTPHLSGSQTEPPGKHMGNHHGGKNKGWGKILQNLAEQGDIGEPDSRPCRKLMEDLSFLIKEAGPWT